MIDAARAYAAHGIPVFPVSARSKNPVAARLKDADGNKISGTGGFKRATTDSQQIFEWWHRAEHLIGVPMGPMSGVWAVDVDTNVEHAVDGIAPWQALLAEHGPLNTRTHRTATGGLHEILIFPDDQDIRCRRGGLPDGVEVKASGGYVVAPPSVRRGKAYTVENDLDPVRPPAWLLDLIASAPLLKAKNKAGNANLNPDRTTPNKEPNAPFMYGDIPPDLMQLASAVAAIPNPDLEWEEWTEVGLAIYAASHGKRGYPIFHAWSKTSSKYDPVKTLQRWLEIDGSPPDRFGVRGRTIYKRAKENGWLPGATPTYPQPTFSDLDAAREKLQQLIHDFLHDDDIKSTNYFAQFAPPPVQALRVGTGIGKTKIAIAEIAACGKPLIYCVPTLRLGSEIEVQFAAHGVKAKVFRGRNADDAENPGTAMCLNLPAVELAMKLHADVQKTCCKAKGVKCVFFNSCGYQRQQIDRPKVWIVASDMAFHHQTAFGKPTKCIIDESFWRKSLRGIEHGEEWSVPFAVLAKGSQGRRDLGMELSAQVDDGGLQRGVIEHMDGHALSKIISAEWGHMPKASLVPGLSSAAVELLAKDEHLIKKVALARRVIRICQELRRMLDDPGIQVSGRLLLEHDSSGLRVIRWRGVAAISEQFSIATLLLDATLPELAMLRILHPDAEIAAEIDVALPESVHVRQVIDAPTSSRKLVSTAHDDHRQAVRRYIFGRWFELGRPRTLVICQEQISLWLADKLPPGVELLHFNATNGLDVFKDVRLLILVGRAQPGPAAVETLAATFGGSMPTILRPGAQNFTWYHQEKRGIRLRNGSGVAVDGDRHPDPFAEAIRRQITEAELIQAFGRARAVNRTPATPLDVDLLLDTVLPITVDAVMSWRAPSLLLATAADGVVLTSPADLTAIWPDLWPNEKAAGRTLAAGIQALPGFVEVTYQRDGPKQKTRLGYFDPMRIPDPQAWLEARLGPLRVIL
jgi:hypothetical protein